MSDLAERVAAERIRQGLPPKVVNPGIVRRLATLFAGKPVAKKQPPRCVRCGEPITGGSPFVELDGQFQHSDPCESPAERRARLRALEEEDEPSSE